MTSDSDSLKELSSIFNDRALKSSQRLLILICLSINRKLGFTELSKLTGLAKGSLGNHLLKLTLSGYIIVTEHSFFSSKRITIKITEKGILTIRKYLLAINELETTEKGEITSTTSADSDFN
ncbi:MAG: MarR family winged helix-turn-helix transcriptional regulator [Candidatus Thermoplasmatota archaeon]|jgi:DNA-binding MarR family transcriptional regulator|nr:MarR family winged helix-turn-helix transcriptional regulator [Candidatus Thermoplasmatota archaeon]MCL5800186.1 MarR family winged helix-turn-helix transcriptional regulator [Candidatus Thermoplasmatota archaeon]